MNDATTSIRTFILTRYLPGEHEDNLRDDTRLQSSGLLDSMAVLELAGFVEREFGITFTATELGVDTFDRIRDIAALVTRKSAVPA